MSWTICNTQVALDTARVAKARYIRITFGTDLVPAEEIKCDVKEIKQELVAQKDRMWGLYVKIIIIACMSGAGLLKLVL